MNFGFLILIFFQTEIPYLLQLKHLKKKKKKKSEFSVRNEHLYINRNL